MKRKATTKVRAVFLGYNYSYHVNAKNYNNVIFFILPESKSLVHKARDCWPHEVAKVEGRGPDS